MSICCEIHILYFLDVTVPLLYAHTLESDPDPSHTRFLSLSFTVLWPDYHEKACYFTLVHSACWCNEFTCKLSCGCEFVLLNVKMCDVAMWLGLTCCM